MPNTSTRPRFSLLFLVLIAGCGGGGGGGSGGNPMPSNDFVYVRTSGDDNNAGFEISCGTERFTITNS